MPWNPCGRIVDYGSRPFKARYRPFRDSSEEVEITWFPAAPGALPLGRTSNITIPYWEKDQFEYTDDDLPLATAEPTGKPVVRPGTGRGHVCGTVEDFREGGIYDPEREPITYGSQGLPTCCGAPVLMRGGVLDSMRSTVIAPGAPSCELASPLALDTWYTMTRTTDLPEQWYVFEVPEGSTVWGEFTGGWFPWVFSTAIVQGVACPMTIGVSVTSESSTVIRFDIGAFGSDRFAFVGRETSPLGTVAFRFSLSPL